MLLPEHPNFHSLNIAEEKLEEQQVFWKTITNKEKTSHNFPSKKAPSNVCLRLPSYMLEI